MEELAVAIATDDELAEAMQIAQADGELTPRQRIKLFYWFGGFMRVCESHIIQGQLEATTIDLATPIRNILRIYAGSSFFRQQMKNAVDEHTATEEFLAWLDAEVLAIP
jgi:hypothetical protein